MKYDTTFKDLLWQGAPALIQQLTGSPPVATRIVEFPSTRNRRPDFLAELLDGRLLHLELQNDPDQRMDYRALEYYGPISEANGGREVFQIVLAVTDKAAAAMPREIIHGNLQFRFTVISWEQLDAAPLLSSPHPHDNVLAILCRSDDMRRRVKEILQRLKSLDENERNDAVARLIVLAGLRKAVPVVMEEVRSMAISIDIEKNEYLKNLFLMGKAEGMAEGKVEGKAEGKVEGKAEGKAESLLSILEHRFGATIPEHRRSQIRMASAATLDTWLLAAFDADSLDAVFQPLETSPKH